MTLLLARPGRQRTILVQPVSAQLRRPRPQSAMSASRRNRTLLPIRPIVRFPPKADNLIEFDLTRSDEPPHRKF
jgi:hypothetical protein